LFIGGSSIQLEQNPVGFAFEPFFTILIFIAMVSSYAAASAAEVLAAECASETSADSKARL
jgi:hypothetical protein